MKQLEQILSQIGKDKLKTVQNKVKNGELDSMLASIDREKAMQLITRLGLLEQMQGMDLETFLKQAKDNPNLTKEIQKRL